MSLDGKIRNRMEQLLLKTDARTVGGQRLVDDARRLWRHAGRWIEQHLASTDRPDAMELACYALQLPMKHMRDMTIGRYGQPSLRDRAEVAAEELLSEITDAGSEALLESTTILLRDLPQRTPKSEDAKLLADVINIEDFGVLGLLNQLILISARGQGIEELLEGAVRREEYGYFEARVKDGFHFGPFRELARRRLARMSQTIALLKSDIQETHR